MGTMVATDVEKFGGFGGTGGFGGGSGQVTARTYAEMLADDKLDPGERRQIRGEACLGLAAHLLLHRGHESIVRLLLDVIRIVVEPDGDRFEPDNLWLEVAPEHMAGFSEAILDKYREACGEIEKRRDYGIWFAGAREILPDVGPEWRENLRQQLSGGKKPTNQARRVRTEPSRPREDGLSFTNGGELKVYQALKLLQDTLPRDKTIGIFPLAGGRIPGHTWEPDVLVTYKNRAGVLEIDGPDHNLRRALDVTRDHLLYDAGVAFVDRIPVEALSDPKELGAALTRFIRRVADTR
jgi:hypothetical protein